MSSHCYELVKTKKTASGAVINDEKYADQTLWLESPSREAVLKFMKRHSLTNEDGWAINGRPFTTWEQGLDAILDESGKIIERATPTLPGVGRGN